MRVFPHSGVPDRGSFRDRVVQEMLLRERRRFIAAHTYQARLVGAGLKVAPALLDLWTDLFIDEVSHANYRPDLVEYKKRILQEISDRKKEPARLLGRVSALQINTAADLMPYTKEEIRERLEQVRQRRAANAMSTT